LAIKLLDSCICWKYSSSKWNTHSAILAPWWRP